LRFTSLALTALTLAPAVFAGPLTFVADLTPGAEIPPAALSSGIGSATVTLDDVAHTLAVHISFSNLLGTTTASHIHCCAPQPGTTSVATQVPRFIGFPVGVTSGTYDNVFNTLLDSTYNPSFEAAHGGTAASAEAALFAGIAAGESYLNVHTSAYGGGEIRGVLGPVPEPGTFVLAGLALGGLLLRRKRW